MLIGVGACGLVGPGDTQVLTGVWGGVEARMSASESAVGLRTTCDSSVFPGPATLGPEGTFNLATHVQQSLWGNTNIRLHGRVIGDSLKATFEFEDILHPGTWISFDIALAHNSPGQFSHYGTLCPL